MEPTRPASSAVAQSTKHYHAWKAQAPLGLATVGLGVSLVGNAIVRKMRQRPWFLAGTIGLVTLNAGLSLFGDAVKHRTLYELGQTAAEEER